MRSALFWDVMRCRVVIVYQCFSKAYRSHLQGSRVWEEKDPWKWDRYIVPERQQTITTQCHVISQNSADLITIAAEVWNQSYTGLTLHNTHNTACGQFTYWWSSTRQTSDHTFIKKEWYMHCRVRVWVHSKWQKKCSSTKKKMERPTHLKTDQASKAYTLLLLLLLLISDTIILKQETLSC
jgi:hypothetical protein